MSGGVPDGMLAITAVGLVLTLLLGLVRIWRGPDMADRMLTAQLFGSTGIALLLVLAELDDVGALRNAALLLALLAVMSTVAFAARVWRPDRHIPGQRLVQGDEDPDAEEGA